MPTYKYDCPLDWLKEAAHGWGKERLYAELLNLARLHDSDTLQDEFQDEMQQAMNKKEREYDRLSRLWATKKATKQQILRCMQLDRQLHEEFRQASFRLVERNTTVNK